MENNNGLAAVQTDESKEKKDQEQQVDNQENQNSQEEPSQEEEMSFFTWLLKLFGIDLEKEKEQEQEQGQQQSQSPLFQQMGGMGGFNMGGFNMNAAMEALQNGDFNGLMNQGIESLQKMGASPSMIEATKDLSANFDKFMKGEMSAKEFMKSDATKNFLKEGKEFAKQQGIPGPMAALGGKVAGHYLGKQMETLEKLRDGKINSKEAIEQSAAPFKKYAKMAGMGQQFDAAVKQAQQYSNVLDAAVNSYKKGGQDQTKTQSTTKETSKKGLSSVENRAPAPKTNEKGVGIKSLGGTGPASKGTSGPSVNNTTSIKKMQENRMKTTNSK